MKNNKCVLLTPDERLRPMDEANDAGLLAVATDRLAKYDPSAVISGEELHRELGITQDDLDQCGEVEIE